MQPLTVETLRQVPRGIRNLLSELQIRCEFFDRGCGKFVQLGDLERHVADCGFAPAVCSNEGCQLEVNKQDLLHHETAVCELRRVKCHSCNDIRREMDTVKVNLKSVNEKLDRNEKDFKRIEETIKHNVEAVENNVIAKVELVQQQLNKQEKSNRQVRADNVEIKKSLNEIMKQLEKMTEQTSDKVQAEEMKKGIAEGGGKDREPKVVVAGGSVLNSVEMFNLATGTWKLLQPMKACREAPSSAVYKNHIFVNGGYSSCTWLTSVEKLSLNAAQDDHSTPWENVPVEIIGGLADHCSVFYNGQLIVIGGYSGTHRQSDCITEISLVPPYTSTLLTTMPTTKCYHGVALFGDKILIVGGSKNLKSPAALSDVIMYDIRKNACQEFLPLPNPLYQMAVVKWGDDNVMIMGGADNNDQPLNKVLMYNIKTQKSHELPNMKYKRKGCVAAVVRDTVIVMGGKDKRKNFLKSVEGFRFDRNSWEELPPMHEARCWATAVAC